ncbi:hypothetical protein Q5P01_025874 [Channa striata]|uniref:Uncharacterized protein n=1 Tax=Channa striata TaxID=64152 RepID=A0AA88IJY3_CHASR|nr:hypothetical protein Q5P01_025874 [Channa striata]
MGIEAEADGDECSPLEIEPEADGNGRSPLEIKLEANGEGRRPLGSRQDAEMEAGGDERNPLEPKLEAAGDDRNPLKAELEISVGSDDRIFWLTRSLGLSLAGVIILTDRNSWISWLQIKASTQPERQHFIQ